MYWLNIALLGVLMFASARYARRAGLLKEDVTAEIIARIWRLDRF